MALLHFCRISRGPRSAAKSVSEHVEPPPFNTALALNASSRASVARSQVLVPEPETSRCLTPRFMSQHMRRHVQGGLRAWPRGQALRDPQRLSLLYRLVTASGANWATSRRSARSRGLGGGSPAPTFCAPISTFCSLLGSCWQQSTIVLAIKPAMVKAEAPRTPATIPRPAPTEMPPDADAAVPAPASDGEYAGTADGEYAGPADGGYAGPVRDSGLRADKVRASASEGPASIPKATTLAVRENVDDLPTLELWLGVFFALLCLLSIKLSEPILRRDASFEIFIGVGLS